MHRVLIVEDEPNIAESLSFILGRAGCDVHVVDDGGAALETFYTIKPDLVILDTMLPRRNGLEILTDIRRDRLHGATPVIMLTAKGQAKDRDRALAAGANLFMTKPFDNTEIVAGVLRLVQPEQHDQADGENAA